MFKKVSWHNLSQNRYIRLYSIWNITCSWKMEMQLIFIRNVVVVNKFSRIESNRFHKPTRFIHLAYLSLRLFFLSADWGLTWSQLSRWAFDCRIYMLLCAFFQIVLLKTWLLYPPAPRQPQPLYLPHALSWSAYEERWLLLIVGIFQPSDESGYCLHLRQPITKAIFSYSYDYSNKLDKTQAI